MSMAKPTAIRLKVTFVSGIAGPGMAIDTPPSTRASYALEFVNCAAAFKVDWGSAGIIPRKRPASSSTAAGRNIDEGIVLWPDCVSRFSSLLGAAPEARSRAGPHPQNTRPATRRTAALVIVPANREIQRTQW